MKTSSSQTSQKKIIKSFDELIINSNAALPEDKFVKDVSNKILKEISTPSDTYKIESLKAQIEDGTYQIMPEEIIRKMLLK